MDMNDSSKTETLAAPHISDDRHWPAIPLEPLAAGAPDETPDSPTAGAQPGNPDEERMVFDDLVSGEDKEALQAHGAGEHHAAAASPDGVAHYEVDVRHYAQYDRSEDAGYTPEVRDSLTYASRTPFSRFFLDLVTILTRPGEFWKGQDEHPATLAQIYWPHLTVLVLLRMVAVMSGGLLQHAISDVPVSRMLVEAGFQTLLIFLMKWLFSLIISGLLALSGSGLQFERSHRYVAYSMTPIFVVGILSILPIPYMDKICDVIAMPWAFLVMGAGIIPYLKVSSDKGPVLTSILCGMLLIMWGMIPMLIPRLIGLMM